MMNKKNLLLGLSLSLLTASVVPFHDGAYAAVNSQKAAEYFDEAKAYMDKGDLEAAIIQMKNAVRANPDNPEVRIVLGQLYNRTANPVSAEKEFRRALQLGAEKQGLMVDLGKSLLMQRKYEDVLTIVEPDVARDADLATAYLVLGNAHQGLGDKTKALEFYLKGESVKEKDDHLSVAIARIFKETDQNEKAMSKVDEALAINPKNVRGLILKGELVHQIGGATKSIEYFQNAIELEPNNVDGLIKTAGALFDLKRDEEALEKLEVVLDRIPRHPLGNYLSAVIYARQNNSDKSLEFLEKAGPALDKFHPALMLRGIINYAQKNYAQATYHLSRLLEIKPDHYIGRRLLGASLLQQDDIEQAIEVLSPLEAAEKVDPTVLALLGSAYLKQRDFAKGTDYFERAAAANPDENRLKTQLALSKLAQGDNQAAELNLKEILEKDPDASQAAIFLALIELENKEYEKVLATADNILEKTPDNPVAYNLQGAAFAGKEENDKSREAFQKAIDLNPEYYSAYMNLARLELKLDNTAEAKSIYQRVLKQKPDHLASLIALSEFARLEKDINQEEILLDKVVQAAPKRLDLRVRQSEFYVNNRQLDKAKASAVKIIQDFPDSSAGYEAAGKIDLLKKDWQSAVVNFQSMTLILEDNPGAFQLLARAQVRANDLLSARKNLEKSIAIAKSESAYIDLIRLDMAQSNFDEAAKNVAALKGFLPEKPTAYEMEGRLLLQQKKFADAVISLDKAADKGATGRDFNILHSQTYFQNNNPAEGQKIIEAWLTENPKDTTARHSLASSMLGIKDYPGAIEQYDLILEVRDDDILALNNLAWLYSVTDKLNEAEKLARLAYELSSENASIIDTYAWILVQKGNAKDALPLLQKAVANAPNMMEIRYHLAVALDQNDRKSSARRELENILSTGVDFAERDEAKKLLQELSQ